MHRAARKLGFFGVRLALTRPSGVADDDGGGVAGSANVAEGECEVATRCASVGMIRDALAIGAGRDGHRIHRLRCLQQRFAGVVVAVAVRVFESDPAVLPPDIVVARLPVAAGADDDFVLARDGRVAREAERGEHRVLRCARLGSMHESAQRGKADGAQYRRDGDADHQFDEGESVHFARLIFHCVASMSVRPS